MTEKGIQRCSNMLGRSRNLWFLLERRFIKLTSNSKRCRGYVSRWNILIRLFWMISERREWQLLTGATFDRHSALSSSPTGTWAESLTSHSGDNINGIWEVPNYLHKGSWGQISLLLRCIGACNPKGMNVNVRRIWNHWIWTVGSVENIEAQN